MTVETYRNLIGGQWLPSGSGRLFDKRSPVEALRSVLTPDQQKILDKNLADSPRDGRGFGPGAGMGRGMGPGGFGPGDGMRVRNGGAPRGFRDGPPPRRPTGEELDKEEAPDLPNR